MTVLAITTSSGASYLINQEEGWAKRLPGPVGVVNEDGYYAVPLRKDGDEIPIIEMETPAVGETMKLFLDVRGDGVVTFRLTTPVTEIIDVTEPAQEQANG